jgi:carboxymethylenebutenolidase
MPALAYDRAMNPPTAPTTPQPTPSPTPTPVRAGWMPIGESGDFEAWLALPPAGQGPGLLLWQEIFGVNAHVRAVAEQFALAGFVVLAPDLFWRQQRHVELGYAGEAFTLGRAFAGALQPDMLRADIVAAARALSSHPAAAGRKIGSVGYCLGGRLAFLSAAWAGVDAAVAYYGGGIHDTLAVLPEARGALQFHYAGHDEHIPSAAVERVRAALQARGTEGDEVHVYPDAHHGFNCWARGSYHPPSAALALGRTLGFLAPRLFQR